MPHMPFDQRRDLLMSALQRMQLGGEGRGRRLRPGIRSFGSKFLPPGQPNPMLGFGRRVGSGLTAHNIGQTSRIL